MFKDGFWVGAGQAATMVAGLLGIKALTTLLPTRIYGEAVLLLGLATLGVGLLGVPVLQANLRFYSDAARDGRVNALRRITYRYMGLGASLVVPLILAGGAVWCLAGGTVPYAAFPIVCVFLVSDVLRSMEGGMLNAARRQKAFAARTVVDAWARPGGAVAAILLFGPTALHVIAGYAAGSVAANLVFARARVRGGDPPMPPQDDEWSSSTRTAFVRYALPLVPLASLNWVMSLSDRYMLGAFAGVSAAGLYAAAYGLGSQPFIVVNSFIHSTLRPILYDAVAAGDRRKERRTLRTWMVAVLVVSAAGVVLFFLLANFVAGLLLGPAFAGAASLLPWIAGAYALQNVQQTCEVMMFAHGQTRRLVFLQGVAAVCGLLLYALLIPRYGAHGAAAATLLTFVVTTAVALVLASAPARLMGPVPQPAPTAEIRRPEATL